MQPGQLPAQLRKSIGSSLAPRRNPRRNKPQRTKNPGTHKEFRKFRKKFNVSVWAIHTLCDPNPNSFWDGIQCIAAIRVCFPAMLENWLWLSPPIHSCSLRRSKKECELRLKKNIKAIFGGVRRAILALATVNAGQPWLAPKRLTLNFKL